MSSLTGAKTTEYTLLGGFKPKHKITWTYSEETSFLQDVEKLRKALGREFYLDGMWRIENGSFGMTISAKSTISIDEYLKRKREALEGAEDESEEE